MSQIKKLKNYSLIVAETAVTTIAAMNSSPNEAQTDKTLFSTEIKETADSSHPNFVKRKKQKVYHRFEEIPEITNSEATQYNRNEYTYIVNADKYQKSGKIELKRVLKDEVTSASTLSLIYRSECQTYNPKPSEDQLERYIIDFSLVSPSGVFKGPSQMNDNAVKSFIKYLIANPKTRNYVLPLVRTTRGDLRKEAQKLEQAFFDSNHKLKNMKERENIFNSSLYQNFILKDNAWKQLASPKLKSTFLKKEESLSARKGRKTYLTNTTKNYLCLTELIPNKKLFKQTLEEYNLGFYQLARKGKTKNVLMPIAHIMNLKNNLGQYDVTRIPTFVIAAAISNMNWKGNGLDIRNDIPDITPYLKKDASKKYLIKLSEKWVTGKSKTSGVKELSKLNILTENIIKQYEIIELPGAKNLSHLYQQAIEREEAEIQHSQHRPSQKIIKEIFQSRSPAKTYIVTAKNFERN